ncbi:VOC family protein [Streptomyces sp. NPDC059373]
MSVSLNHTIVHSRDRRAAAEFLASVLGLEVGTAWGPFLPVATDNGVTLDFTTAGPDETITPQHYAFLVSEKEFDAGFEKIQQAGIPYWADPAQRQPGRINHNDGGRGVYFLDPSGHYLELITRPYGSGS